MSDAGVKQSLCFCIVLLPVPFPQFLLLVLTLPVLPSAVAVVVVFSDSEVCSHRGYMGYGGGVCD